MGPNEARAQSALVLDVRGGVAAPAGSFKRGPEREGSIGAGPTFGLLFDLRRGDHLGLYVGFSQVLFDCSSDGCVGDEEFVSTSWDLGIHLRARSTTWGPWLRGGVVFTRMERDIASPEGPGHEVSDLGVGGELGVGLRVRLTERFGLNPGVRFALLNTRLENGDLLRMRYWVLDFGLVMSIAG